MIHRESRDRLAWALRRYVAGRITNDDLDDVDVNWRDRGAVAVKEMAWNLYDDLATHFVEDDLPRGSEGRAGVFLHPGLQPAAESSHLRLVGEAQGAALAAVSEAGDFEVWPFISKQALQRALAEPRLLTG